MNQQQFGIHEKGNSDLATAEVIHPKVWRSCWQCKLLWRDVILRRGPGFADKSHYFGLHATWTYPWNIKTIIIIVDSCRQSPSINGFLGAVLRCSEYVSHDSVKGGAILLGPRMKIHIGFPILKYAVGAWLSKTQSWLCTIHDLCSTKTFSSGSITGVPKNTEETANLHFFATKSTKHRNFGINKCGWKTIGCYVNCISKMIDHQVFFFNRHCKLDPNGPWKPHQVAGFFPEPFDLPAAAEEQEHLWGAGVQLTFLAILKVLDGLIDYV